MFKESNINCIVYVLIVLIEDGKILLLQRKKTGLFDGYFGLVGGKLDGNESAMQAAIRETYEEVGIKVRERDLKFCGVLHEKYSKGEFIAFTFAANTWNGQVSNKEPNKHSSLDWFDINKLPKNLMPAHDRVISMLKRGRFYTEYGWDD